MTQLEKNFLDFALQECGAPYIWQGKGDKLWTPNGMVPSQFTTLDNPPKPLRVFDCSGLITWALYLATGGRMDLRGTHSAKTIWDTWPEARAENMPMECPLIRCYPHHVAIDLDSALDIVLDANKGDENCTTPLLAQQRGARVEVHRNVRPVSSLLGYRRLPIDVSELRKV